MQENINKRYIKIEKEDTHINEDGLTNEERLIRERFVMIIIKKRINKKSIDKFDRLE